MLIAFEILNLCTCFRCNKQTFLNFWRKNRFFKFSSNEHCSTFYETNKMTPKLSNFKIVLGYWNENSDSCFRFNNPKQCSNWIILVSFCLSHLAIKIAIMFILWKFKKLMQKSIFPQKIQKSLCITTKSLYTNFKRNYLENYNDSEHAVETKNAPFFINFPNI